MFLNITLTSKNSRKTDLLYLHWKSLAHQMSVIPISPFPVLFLCKLTSCDKGKNCGALNGYISDITNSQSYNSPCNCFPEGGSLSEHCSVFIKVCRTWVFKKNSEAENCLASWNEIKPMKNSDNLEKNNWQMMIELISLQMGQSAEWPRRMDRDCQATWNMKWSGMIYPRGQVRRAVCDAWHKADARF